MRAGSLLLETASSQQGRYSQVRNNLRVTYAKFAAAPGRQSGAHQWISSPQSQWTKASRAGAGSRRENAARRQTGAASLPRRVRDWTGDESGGGYVPAIYWLPLPAMRRPAAVEHLHAAFSAWFDSASGHNTHKDPVKPYRLAPMSQRDGVWGVEVSLLTKDVFDSLAEHITAGVPVRLGRNQTDVGAPRLVHGESWEDLATWEGESAWRVHFLTPFASRTTTDSGSRTSPFPAPAAALRAATDAWHEFSGRPPVRLSPADQAHLWVSHVELSTTRFTINGHDHPGALGTVVYRADTRDVAASASRVFRLAAYCGMGSFRGKGMGVVAVEPLRGRTRA